MSRIKCRNRGISDTGVPTILRLPEYSLIHVRELYRKPSIDAYNIEQ